MKIKFKFCCYEEIRDYVEQTPQKVIEEDLTKWIEELINEDLDWEYVV